MKPNDPAFAETMESQSFSVGLSQIITKNLILSGQYEVITDEGFLRSPYRSVRFFIDSDAPRARSPRNTRTRVRAMPCRSARKYFLPYRAAIDAMYRFYTDTWGIVGHTAELGYVHPLDTTGGTGSSKAACATTRRPPPTSTRTSSRAPTTPTSWRATRSSRPTTRSPRASAPPTNSRSSAFRGSPRAQLNLRYDYMTINYDDFRDARYSIGSFGVPPDDPLAPGTEPLYQAQRQHLPVLHLGVFLKGIVF